MTIDKYFFDKKNRYYSFYLCVQKWIFHFALSIANLDFSFHVGMFPELT